jgi:hypothetical protein
MSKFTDKLGHIYRTTGPALGFRKPDAEAEPPPLLLIATITPAGAKKTKSIAESGIDAAVVNSKNIEAASFKELAAGMNNTPLGLAIDDGSKDEVEELMKLDWDFVIFGLQMPVDAINKEGLGKIVRIEPSLAPGLARAINELSPAIDGVLIAGESSAVTVERLLACQFLAGVVGKPLIVPVDSSLTSSELGSLHEAGIKGLLFPEGTTLKAFAELKKLVSSLPKTRKRKTGTSVLLPRLGVSEPKVEKEEEEEEEEDI